MNNKRIAASVLAAIVSSSILGCFESTSESAIENPSNTDNASTIANPGNQVLGVDNYTMKMFEFNDLDSVESVPAISQLGILITPGQVVRLDTLMKDSIPAGTVEFWFKPAKDFYMEDRTLLGTDGARLHFMYANGNLIFQKNLSNQHRFVKVPVILPNRWTLISGQWGDGFISIYLNGKLAGRVIDSTGYQPSPRGDHENDLIIGYKSYCCMEGPGVSHALSASGYYDQLRLSSIPRYAYQDSVDTDSSTTPDTLELEDDLGSIGLTNDSNTIVFQEFENIDTLGNVAGIDGDAVKIEPGQVLTFNALLDDTIPVGTIEFWFRPAKDFADKPRTLLGTDGARLHFLYNEGKLVFQKNLSNMHIFVEALYTFSDQWTLVAAQWGNGYLSLFIDGKLLAQIPEKTGYVPSERNSSENDLLIGFKSACCMEGPGVYENLYSSGYYDQLRLSNVLRYTDYK